MSREWTKEPWYAHGPHIEDKHGNRVNLYDHNPSNRERAAVCVSACATLSDPTTSIPALLRVAEAAMKYVADWDSQVSDPHAACYQCDDPDHIASLRSALSALPASDERGGA